MVAVAVLEDKRMAQTRLTLMNRAKMVSLPPPLLLVVLAVAVAVVVA